MLIHYHHGQPPQPLPWGVASNQYPFHFRHSSRSCADHVQFIPPIFMSLSHLSSGYIWRRLAPLGYLLLIYYMLIKIGYILRMDFKRLFQGLSVIASSNYVLFEFGFPGPTVFQGWQTFTCAVLLSALVKFQKVSGDVKILDKRSFLLMLPGFICFVISIVAGSKGLSGLPVPIYCAVLSLNPAILVLMDKNNDFTENSKRVCGSAAICGTVVVILVLTLDRLNFEDYLWLIAHVILSVIYTLYMDRINVDVSRISKIYYRNCFAVTVLLPISIYLNALRFPRGFSIGFYLGCILSGILGTFLQIVTFEMEQKSSFMNCQGRAKLLCTLLAHNFYSLYIEPIVWVIIVINLLINSFVLSPQMESSDFAKKPKLTLFVGPPLGRELDLEKTISV